VPRSDGQSFHLDVFSLARGKYRNSLSGSQAAQEKLKRIESIPITTGRHGFVAL
jgi:hypothetical protein